MFHFPNTLKTSDSCRQARQAENRVVTFVLFQTTDKFVYRAPLLLLLNSLGWNLIARCRRLQNEILLAHYPESFGLELKSEHGRIVRLDACSILFEVAYQSLANIA